MLEALAAQEALRGFPGPPPPGWICLSSARSATAPQPFVLSLALLEPDELMSARPAILLVSAAGVDLADAELPDHLCHRHALAMQNCRLPQLADYLLAIVAHP